jgi:DNA-directed RNA polymerase specialized sigma24 family protein
MRSSTDRQKTSEPAPGRPTGAWLLQQHRLFIARYARQLGRGVAEDLASEAVVRTLRYPAPDGHHGPWLERVFRNLLVDHLRRCARGQRVGAMADDTAPRSDSPEQRAAEAQLRRRLAALWPELRPEWQQALASSFSEDPVTAEAGLSPITLRTRTFRALGMLRRALGVARGWLPTPLSLSGQLQPLAAGLIPGALAVTAVVAPAAPEPPRVSAPLVFAQRVERQPAATTPAPPPPAPAQPARARPSARPPAPPPVPDPPRAVERFQFDDDDITGDLQRPNDEQVTGAPAHLRHSSLIEIPGSFTAAFVRTFEDL